MDGGRAEFSTKIFILSTSSVTVPALLYLLAILQSVQNHTIIILVEGRSCLKQF